MLTIAWSSTNMDRLMHCRQFYCKYRKNDNRDNCDILLLLSKFQYRPSLMHACKFTYHAMCGLWSVQEKCLVTIQPLLFTYIAIKHSI